jgi:hypothetical protein
VCCCHIYSRSFLLLKLNKYNIVSISLIERAGSLQNHTEVTVFLCRDQGILPSTRLIFLDQWASDPTITSDLFSVTTMVPYYVLMCEAEK